MKAALIGLIIGLVAAVIVFGAIVEYRDHMAAKEQCAETLKIAIADEDNPNYPDIAVSDYEAYAEQSRHIKALIDAGAGVSCRGDIPHEYEMIADRFLFARYARTDELGVAQNYYAIVTYEQVIDGVIGSPTIGKIIDHPRVRYPSFTNIEWKDGVLVGTMSARQAVIIAFRVGEKEGPGMPYGPSTRRESGHYYLHSIRMQNKRIFGSASNPSNEWVLASNMRWAEASEVEAAKARKAKEKQ